MKKIRAYHYILYYLLLAVKAVFSVCPYRLVFSFGGSIGKLAYYILPRERDRALAHLQLAFGREKSEAEVRKIALRMFEHFGHTMVEFIMIDRITSRLHEFTGSSGFENFDNALKKGKGIVVVIAHFGNWELMGAYASLNNYPCNVIARKIYFKKYDDYVVEMRKKTKMKTIYRDESPRAMLSVFKRNELLGFVVDQDISFIEGIFVNFFGRPAFTPVAPVRFSMVSGAPIIPVFMIREGMKHHMFIETPIELVNTGDKEADLRVNTQKWVDVQEKYIRKYPHLWVWNHRRWKTQLADTKSSFKT